MFDWAVSLDYCPSSVAYGLHCIKRLSQSSRAKPAKKIDPVPIRDVGRTLKYTTSIVADMIRVQLRTGMRSGELCKLQARDINASGEVWIAFSVWTGWKIFLRQLYFRKLGFLRQNHFWITGQSAWQNSIIVFPVNTLHNI